MSFNIELCGISIGIEHRYEYIKKLCTEYLTDKSPEFTVSVTDAQIEAEMKGSEYRFSKELCEGTCIHRETVKGLVKYGVLLMHSAVVAVDGKAYVFMAKSGVGKSTHIRLWLKLFGERATVVNGDKPMFSFEGETLNVHGSPWKGKEGYGERITVPVGAVCFLERGENNSVERASEADIVEKIFHQVLLPENVEDITVFMSVINRIVKAVPFYKLKCNMDIEAARVAFYGMQKNKES